MQLKPDGEGQGSIRQALALAACSLLGGGASAQAADTPWEIDSAVLLYSEADGRVSAIEPVATARKEIREDEFVQLKVVVDALTGASPNGATPSVRRCRRPSGRSQLSETAPRVSRKVSSSGVSPGSAV